MTVAALFVETDGAYFELPGVDPWDKERDARLYPGPWPVVAHPPCNRWCQLSGLIEAVYGYKRGDDGGCFESALTSVRTFGGVLEHPAHSHAWAHFGLQEPTSDGWVSAVVDEGWVAYVEQERYGHPARKPTWLYAYGVELPEMRWGRRKPRPDDIGWHVRTDRPWEHKRGERRMRDKRASKTPPAFRDVLLGMARSCGISDEARQSADLRSGASGALPDPASGVGLVGRGHP